MNRTWSRLGGQLGVGLCIIGFLFVFLGWNGAASSDRVPSQFPYLISGGVAGLCFVVIGVGMIIVQNQRADRAALVTTLRQLQETLERADLGLPGGHGADEDSFQLPPKRPTPTAVTVPVEPAQPLDPPEPPIDHEPEPEVATLTKRASNPAPKRADKPAAKRPARAPRKAPPRT